jgi:hypothetical protein
VTGGEGLRVGTANGDYAIDATSNATTNSNLLRLLRTGVLESSAFFKITLASTTAGQFIPIFWGKATGTTSVPAMWFLGDLNTGLDSTTNAMMRFETRYRNGAVGTRPLFEWRNFTTTKMKMNNAGDLDLYAGNFTTTGEYSQSKIKLTTLGGTAVKLTNKTGANSVAGQFVRTSTTTADAVQTTAANDVDVIGVVLDAGISDGSEIWVVVGGIADVLVDAGGSTLGDRMITSATAGSCATSNTPAIAAHFQEVGHILEARVGAGLARCNLHFL